MIVIINGIFQCLQLLIFASVIVSWLPLPPSHPAILWIRRCTEPLYAPIRRYTNRIPTGPIDFAPMICLIIIYTIHQLILWLALQNQMI